MAVAVVDTGTATYNSANVATQNYTFTVSAGATLAVFFIAQDNTQSVTSVTWDQGGTNQACTLVGSKSCPTASNGNILIYAVVNPTVGTSKTLSVVQGTSTACAAELQSYSGTVTSSVAAACTNVLTANGTTTGNIGTAAQSGASGDMYISGYVCPNSISSVNDTQIFLLAPTGDDSAANRLASTGASASLTASVGTGGWAAISVDIKASGGFTWLMMEDTHYRMVTNFWLREMVRHD